ncbi:MAG: hypothetical protein AAF387_00365 [Pseudomonadota bacterium]
MNYGCILPALHLPLQFSIAAADLNLVEYKLDLLRIVCCHEHYVQLNLPLLPKAMMSIVGDNINSIVYSGYSTDTLKVVR